MSCVVYSLANNRSVKPTKYFLFSKRFEVLQKLYQEIKMGQKKMQMEEKTRASKLFEKGESVIAVAKDIGVSRKAIY